jgi:predicted transcriptional regulator
MACINPDGKPIESGTRILRALKSGFGTPDDIAKEAGLALFRIRSGLRELSEASFVQKNDDIYQITDKGTELIS